MHFSISWFFFQLILDRRFNQQGKPQKILIDVEKDKQMADVTEEDERWRMVIHCSGWKKMPSLEKSAYLLKSLKAINENFLGLNPYL